MNLALSNVINISVSQTPTGLGNYNTSNLALFTQEVPNLGTFGSLGYAIYLNPTQCGIDFGTGSITYQKVNSIFSQQPNILANGGYVVVILYLPQIQTITYSGAATSGSFSLDVAQVGSVTINWNDSNPGTQASIRAISSSLANVVMTGSPDNTFTLTFYGWYSNDLQLSTTSSNTLMNGSVSVTLTVTASTVGDTQATAITRTQGLVAYFAVCANVGSSVNARSSDVLAAAAVVQPLLMMILFASNNSADIQPGGILDQLRSGGYTHSRGLYYGGNTVLSANLFMTSYAGRAFSTNFAGSNTTQNIHLKVLNGVQPDPTITQTLLNAAQTAGADCYIALQASANNVVSRIFASGANMFFDQVYNLLAFVGDLQIAEFNYLADTDTKIPQTESGMDGFKGAGRQICTQYVGNQYLAPNPWTGSTTFGNQVDFLNNIAQYGFYIYSTPISQQSQAARAARQSTLIQIAIKEAGAIDSGNIIVYVNS